MVTPAAKRKAVAHLRDAFGMSERRACKAIGCCRMTMRYQTTRADDAGLRQRMRAIAQERRRFGYRRLHVLLKREGYLVNHKKLFPALPGGEADSAPPRRSQAGDRDQGADAGSDDAERPVVARLCVGSTYRRPPLPHPDRCR
jgi:transposase InsO family protein